MNVFIYSLEHFLFFGMYFARAVFLRFALLYLVCILKSTGLVRIFTLNHTKSNKNRHFYVRHTQTHQHLGRLDCSECYRCRCSFFYFNLMVIILQHNVYLYAHPSNVIAILAQKKHRIQIEALKPNVILYGFYSRWTDFWGVIYEEDEHIKTSIIFTSFVRMQIRSYAHRSLHSIRLVGFDMGNTNLEQNKNKRRPNTASIKTLCCFCSHWIIFLLFLNW